MKTKILNVLRKSDGYVSGQALCNMLGVSRTAVWKVINQLKEEGYVIEAVQNKGYHITQYPDILTSSEIMSQLTCVDTGNTTGIIREVVYYDETDSTNNEAKRAAERDNAADGTLYITESQTGGRGRRGRNWDMDVTSFKTGYCTSQCVNAYNSGSHGCAGGNPQGSYRGRT